jgi:hypothetical protein
VNEVARVQIAIAGCDCPSRVALDQGYRLGVAPERWGIVLYESDWERMVRLSAREALGLLEYLRLHEVRLAQMAIEDEEAVQDTGRALAERAWRAPAAATGWDS